MSKDKICPIMSKVTTGKGVYTGYVHDLHKVECLKEECMMYSPKDNRPGLAAIEAYCKLQKIQ